MRDPSPGRDSAVKIGAFGPKEEVDPVPPLPAGYVTAPHRRAASLEPTGPRVGSPRGSAPGTRGGPTGKVSPAFLDSSASTGNSSPRPSSGLQRRNSRNSINFSYPINARPNSPRQPSITNVPTDATSIRTLSPTEPFGIEFSHHVYVHKMEPVTEVTSQDKQVSLDSPSATNGDAHQAAQAKLKPADGKNTNRIDTKSPVAHKPAPARTARPTTPKSRVSPASPPRKEDRAVKDKTQDPPSAEAKPNRVQDDPIVEPSSSLIQVKEIPTLENEPDTSGQRSPRVNGSSPRSHTTSRNQTQRESKRQITTTNQHHSERPSSLSPTRSTRFSEHLEVVFPGDHLHEPPPRSKSPAKSALKSTTSNHNATPERPASRRLKLSDAQSESDGTSVLSDEGSKLSWKRKAMKVSFEDETEVLGAPASSPPTSPDSIVPSSPQSKWGDSLRGRAQQVDDLDEVLTPRPALPSFGSIRGRKPAANSEGDGPVTIRPGHSRPSLAGSVFAETFSSDFAVGGVLAASRSKEATQKAVTSVEGDGFESASISEFSSDEADPEEFVLSDHLRRNKLEREEISSTRTEKNNVPVIAIQPATPMVEEYPQASPELEDIPGAFPDTSTQQRAENWAADDTDDTDSESGNSVYSDAAENIADVEGDGFGSINAIVSGSPPQSPKVAAVWETTKAPALISKMENGVSRDGRPQDHTSLPTVREPLPTVVMEDNDDPTPVTSPPVRKRSTKTNGAPKKSSNKPQNPSAAGAAAAKASQRKLEDSATFKSAVALRNKTTSPANTSSEKAAKQQTTGAISQNNMARQSPRRTLSNGSDSSSSFKRERRRRPSTGSYTFRQTMRTEFHEERRLAGPDLHQHRPFSSGSGHSALRTTLRSSNPVSHGRSSSSPFSAMKSFKPTLSSSNVRETGSRSAFRSRFDDSSDDEFDETKLRPVRGIPRRKGEVDGDSTALEDSSDSEAEREYLKTLRKRPNSKRSDAPGLAAAAAAGRTSQLGLSTHTQFDRPTSSHKRGVLSRMSFSRRHHDSEEKVKKPIMESATRRDTPLERPQLELEQVRNTERYLSELNAMGTVTSVTAGTTPASPPKNRWSRLSSRSQKPANKLTRHQPNSKTVGNISWPLPLQEQEPLQPVPPLPAKFDENRGKNGYNPSVVSSDQGAGRPHTSDGVNLGRKQNAPDGSLSDVDSNWTSRFMARRHHRRGTESTVDGSIVSDIGAPKEGRSKKKSRFPMLRKAFGLS